MKRFLKKQARRIWLPWRKGEAVPLFIFAHPRSGSSLLMHILADHPQIAGFGEYFTTYSNQEDYDLAAFDIRRKAKQLLKPVRYVVNQVNHHSVTPDLELVKQNVFCIFLYRQPQETLSSMLELSDFKGLPMTQEEVTANYIRRLKDQTELAGEMPKDHRFHLSYEELLKDPYTILTQLAEALQLQTPLKSKYQTKSFTGVWGDPSQHIAKGSIVRTDSPQRKLRPELLKQATAAYDKTHSFFNNSHATGI